MDAQWEAHGGYLARPAQLEGLDLLALARDALLEDGGDPEDCSLLVSAAPGGRVVRLAYDAPHTYGRQGALWYHNHHALAVRLSERIASTVHSYVLEPDSFEEVMSYGAGRRVGGERLRYEDVQLPELDEDSLEVGLDEQAFEKLKSRWPLGHLARVLGTTRDALLRLPRAPGVLLSLSSDRLGPIDAGSLARSAS